MNYVFDVDGTLTPSRQLIDPEFKNWFLSFCSDHNVYLVTGSDYPKTLEQLGIEICNAVKGVYSCSGNALYINGDLQYVKDFDLTSEQRTYLEFLLVSSPYINRTGNHIEMRTGLCNFSVVGRNASNAEREDYKIYDESCHERDYLSTLIRAKFPDLDATVAGDTGIDIHKKGSDKSQIAEVVTPFIFFGDKIIPGGNDYTIAQLAEVAHTVTSWEDTFNILKTY